MFLPESADSWISLSQSVPCVVSTKEVLVLGLAVVSPLSFYAFLGSVVMVWSFALHWLSHTSPLLLKILKAPFQYTPRSFIKVQLVKSRTKKNGLWPSQLRTGREEKTFFFLLIEEELTDITGVDNMFLPACFHRDIRMLLFVEFCTVASWLACQLGAEGSPLHFWNVLEDLKSRCDSWPALNSVQKVRSDWSQGLISDTESVGNVDTVTGNMSVREIRRYHSVSWHWIIRN